MSIFKCISQDKFLSEIWQQQTYVFHQALLDAVDIVDGNDLAGLACEGDVESRIIHGYQDANMQQVSEWKCEQGSFDENLFTLLPEKNWTLLVQGVEQWFAEIKTLQSYFNFLPSWRLEDVMASYAPIGGGVGPHFDYYDVFLIQVSGSRQWQLGQSCDESTSLQENDQVKLLDHFTTEQSCEIQPGDILYIPAGRAHWGVATSDDCITLSIGFRAPSEQELLLATLDNLAQDLSNNQRYQDTTESIDEHLAAINVAAHQQVAKLLQTLTPERLQQAATTAFGQLVTECRHATLLDSDEQDYSQLIQQAIDQQCGLSVIHPPSSRLAFDHTHLFVNGEAYTVDEVISRAICDSVLPFALLPQSSDLLVLLAQRGDIILEIIKK